MKIYQLQERRRNVRGKILSEHDYSTRHDTGDVRVTLTLESDDPTFSLTIESSVLDQNHEGLSLDRLNKLLNKYSLRMVEA